MRKFPWSNKKRNRTNGDNGENNKKIELRKYGNKIEIQDPNNKKTDYDKLISDILNNKTKVSKKWGKIKVEQLGLNDKTKVSVKRGKVKVERPGTNKSKFNFRSINNFSEDKNNKTKIENRSGKIVVKTPGSNKSRFGRILKRRLSKEERSHYILEDGWPSSLRAEAVKEEIGDTIKQLRKTKGMHDYRMVVINTNSQMEKEIMNYVNGLKTKGMDVKVEDIYNGLSKFKKITVGIPAGNDDTSDYVFITNSRNDNKKKFGGITRLIPFLGKDNNDIAEFVPEMKGMKMLSIIMVPKEDTQNFLRSNFKI